jgi:hypothetical protein
MPTHIQMKNVFITSNASLCPFPNNALLQLSAVLSLLLAIKISVTYSLTS